MEHRQMVNGMEPWLRGLDPLVARSELERMRQEGVNGNGRRTTLRVRPVCHPKAN